MIQYHLSFSEGIFVRVREKDSKRLLYLDTLKSLAKEEDREALGLLVKIRLRSERRVEMATFEKVEIPLGESAAVMEALAKTGRLLYQNGRLEWGGKKKIYWKGEKHSERACTLRAVLGEFTLEQCEKVFPEWALVQGKIVGVESSIPWKWIEQFLRGPVLLEGIEKKRFLEEEPPILWEKEEKEAPLEVFPVLVLTDQTGCFANLWMDYGKVGQVAFEDLAPAVNGRGRLKKEEAAWERDLLEAGFMRKVVGNSRYFCPGDRAREVLKFLLELGWKVKDGRGRRVVRQTGCSWKVREEGAKIAVRGMLLFGEKSASVKKGGKWVELDGESVGLGEEVLELEGEWVGEELLMQRNAFGVLAQEKGVEWEGALREMAEGVRAPEFSPPTELFRGKLLPYQQKGVDWLNFLYGWGFSGLLADEMGLGKTVQVLAFFSHLRTNLPVLIVAPSSLLYHWKAEIERFLPGTAVSIYAGPERKIAAGWMVTSYAILRLDEEILRQIPFEVIVLDESNAIKTASTQTAKAACRLQGKLRLALSGTPMENRPEELASQFQFLMPNFKGKIGPFLLRRKKSEVEIELPEKIEQIAWVEMHAEQEAIYQSYWERARSGLLEKIERDGMSAHRMEMLEVILRLRQIASDPRLIGEKVKGSKLELLLEELPEGKVLIYSQFTSMLRLIGEELGREFLYLDGSTPIQERAKRVQQFQEDPEAKIFLVSLKAGGVGLNLTAADYVLLFDPWWNVAVENQAIDRAHRIGRKKAVIAKRYLVPNSIEEKMLRLKEEKRLVAEQLLEGEEFNWTEEDWLHLLM